MNAITKPGFHGRKFLVILTAAVMVILFMRLVVWTDPAHDVLSGPAPDGVSAANITRLPGSPDNARIRTSRAARPAAAGFRATTATASTATTTSASADRTSEPLYQEKYLAALTAMMEVDGRDNALIHYALAFELAPPHPTDEQARLIKMVMEEGWDERAEPLLPYLMAWQAAFEKLHDGAKLDYARGIGFEMGFNAPVPNFLAAQNAGKMLSVYSRYLQSQGKAGEALQQINTALTMGRDFNSPDNFLISNLIGTAIENVAMNQLNQMVDNNLLSPAQLQAAQDRLRVIEQGQPHMQTVIDGEMQATLIALLDAMDNPTFQAKMLAQPEYAGLLKSADGTPISKEQFEAAYRERWALLTDQFSKPYWQRSDEVLDNGASPDSSNPITKHLDMMTHEIRFLATTSRLRQQQIDMAVQRYIADFMHPPADIGTLVAGQYLPVAPVDPFTGNAFTYTRNENNYELYGSGPSITSKPDPAIDWTPAKGTWSGGVIRTR